MKDKTTAAILALLLGGVGVHRFYLNQVGIGIAYLIFCWTFVPAIIALIDAIIFFTTSDEAFNEKYNDGKVKGASSSMNTAEELEKLHSLMQKGVLTEEEFQARKSKLL